MAKAAQKTEETLPSQSETHTFSAEISKVLQLMIHSLYTNKDIFLRELISNASDACDKLRYRGLTEPELMEGEGELCITIRCNPDEHYIEVTDNGIGMNREDMVEHLGTIARSGTLDFISGLASGGGKDMNLIGQFGVGFYSSFMVAERVVVLSRKAGESQAYRWESEGKGEYTVEPESGEHARGTTVRLYLMKEHKAYLDSFRLSHIIRTYSDHIAFPIWLDKGEGEPERVNDGSALWTRGKSEISDEQYKEFYHHVAHSPDEPWLTLHNKAEGTLAYTNLLFVPSIKPFDLFHPERRARVKLYVKRVFITDESVELVPPYLRFLRGIIDSEDLPLNVSRETLQDNPLLKKIEASITSKVLSELKKKAEKDPEGFLGFWQNFGAVVKEGLCEANSPREKILEVCRFYSTSFDGLTSMEEVASRMKEGQTDIYYLTGDDVETLRHSPMLEGFKKRGVEVLLFADHVDDFWVNVVNNYQGKPLKSITRANIDLDSFAPLEEDADTPAEKKDEATRKSDSDSIAALISIMKTVFGGEVRDVRTTSKLADTPACLAVEEGDIDLRMERFLVEHKQLRQKTAKILEINPHHPLVKTLAKLSAEAPEGEEVRDISLLLLDQARIVEGEPIQDAAAFAARFSRYVQKGLTSKGNG